MPRMVIMHAGAHQDKVARTSVDTYVETHDIVGPQDIIFLRVNESK
jgi:hypothetical protein